MSDTIQCVSHDLMPNMGEVVEFYSLSMCVWRVCVCSSVRAWVDHLVHFKNDVWHNIERIKII